MSGTDLSAILLRNVRYCPNPLSCYAMSGTGLPAILLCDVRYWPTRYPPTRCAVLSACMMLPVGRA
eukprot:3269630-Rhodomonas_salina.1